MDKNQIIDSLKEIHHPGKQNKDIVELGMVDEVKIEEGKVIVHLAFSKQRDPLSEYIKGGVRASIIRNFPEVKEVEVKTFVKTESSAKTNNVNNLTNEELKNVKHIIGVASGKGGVGKSTVSVNLAIALSKLGFKVGLCDADVYGPSIPIMTGTEGEIPEVINEEGKEIIMPIEKFGIKWMSIGYFAQPGQALIWRGPMACSALKQMILQIRWGELDFLLIDMPPGTGDIHISLVQDIPMEGAVIVTTPQNVALADVEKGVDMFRNKDVNKRIYGIVENMSWFTPAELPNNKYYLFGKDGGANMAKSFGLPLLAQIPIVQSIREAGDAGEPIALQDNRADSKAFLELAKIVSSMAEID